MSANDQSDRHPGGVGLPAQLIVEVLRKSNRYGLSFHIHIIREKSPKGFSSTARSSGRTGMFPAAGRMPLLQCCYVRAVLQHREERAHPSAASIQWSRRHPARTSGPARVPSQPRIDDSRSECTHPAQPSNPARAPTSGNKRHSAGGDGPDLSDGSTGKLCSFSARSGPWDLGISALDERPDVLHGPGATRGDGRATTRPEPA